MPRWRSRLELGARFIDPNMRASGAHLVVVETQHSNRPFDAAHHPRGDARRDDGLVEGIRDQPWASRRCRPKPNTPADSTSNSGAVTRAPFVTLASILGGSPGHRL